MTADSVDMVAIALAAGQGDPRAVSELVSRTSPVVWRVCAALVDRGCADDLTQDTYLRAIRSLASYRGESEPVPWLLTIARRVCAEEIGRRQRERHTAARLAAARPLPAPEIVARVELLDALRRIPIERREALVLTCVVGLSYAAAAEICGCPVGTIRSRVSRARVDLAAALRPNDSDTRDADTNRANTNGANTNGANTNRAGTEVGTRS